MVTNQNSLLCGETPLSLLRCTETQCKELCSHNSGSTWCAAICLHNSCCGSFNAPNSQKFPVQTSLIATAHSPLLIHSEDMLTETLSPFKAWLPEPEDVPHQQCCFPQTHSHTLRKYFRSPAFPEQNSVLLFMLIFAAFVVKVLISLL